LKLLIGLYVPGSGTIKVGGRPLSSWGLQSYRSQIGVVMQDDQLLSGTVADNVAFFDAQMDYARVEECCRRAHVHDDIVRMPLGYHSLIGDMGSTLSGGQRQRVLLARALYKQPSILFMDEGTANLDPALETAVLRTVKELGCTVVMVAHREAAVEMADQVFQLDRSRLLQIVVERGSASAHDRQVA
jgi:ATP-binding cassette subfamily B protein RaxB